MYALGATSPEPWPLCMRIFGILLWTIKKRIFCLLLYAKMQHLWGLKGGKQGHFGGSISLIFLSHKCERGVGKDVDEIVQSIHFCNE
jgi:hypothetical protein